MRACKECVTLEKVWCMRASVRPRIPIKMYSWVIEFLCIWSWKTRLRQCTWRCLMGLENHYGLCLILARKKKNHKKLFHIAFHVCKSPSKTSETTAHHLFVPSDPAPFCGCSLPLVRSPLGNHLLRPSVSWKWKCESLSHFQLSATPWTVACQAPLSMEFSR